MTDAVNPFRYPPSSTATSRTGKQNKQLDRLQSEDFEDLGLSEPLFSIRSSIGGVDTSISGGYHTDFINLTEAAEGLMAQLVEARASSNRESISKEGMGLLKKMTQLYEQLLQDSHRDGLTGVYNQRFFESQWPQMLEEAHQTNQPISLIVLDLDKFKHINDRCGGHEMGNIVLKEVAAQMKRLLRAQDKVCRVGGEEFAIVLPQTDERSAQQIGERLLEGFPALTQPNRYLHDKRETSKVLWQLSQIRDLSASMGVVTVPANTDPIHSTKIWYLADQAAIKAKQNGRNRLFKAVLFQESEIFECLGQGPPLLWNYMGAEPTIDHSQLKETLNDRNGQRLSALG